MIYILNDEYILRNDIKRVILTTKDSDGVTTFIHPVQAMILSLFDEAIEYDVNVKRISDILSIDENDVLTFTSRLLCNKEKIWIGNESHACQFPEQVLIEIPDNYKPRGYRFRDYFIKAADFDYQSLRLYKPIEMILMTNTLCYTDCVYCYADRTLKSNLKIPLERLFEIIDEAKSLGFIRFDISGGEFFLYKNWEKLLRKLVSSGYTPAIPTKIPLDKCTIKKILGTGLEEIQISLDSIDPVILSKSLHVNTGYFRKLKVTFDEMNNSGLKFRVNTVITSINCNYSGVEELITYLKQFKCFDEISIGIMGCSAYKSNLINQQLLPAKKEAYLLFDKLKEKYEYDTQIILSDIRTLDEHFRFTQDDFFNKAMCTGNFQSFYLLPDGKVTVCEELYWHPSFIIGDLNKQSIMEMWSSEKAISLYRLSKRQVSKKSKCFKCTDFNYCHQSGSICWKEVIKAYGQDHWDFPDPRCPNAPQPKYQLFVE